MNIDFALPKEVTRIWDLDVPILVNKNITEVYLTDGIEEPSMYNELCYLLKNASKAETFHIHLNTPGGIIDSAFMIISAIKSSQANTVAHLSGTVASAGTVIALACDDLVVANHTSFMIHNYSGGMMGKGHEMKARQEFVDASLSEAFRDIYLGFLSGDEMQEVIDGKDMWMGKDEVLSRFKGTYHQKATSTKAPKKDKLKRNS